MNRTSQRVLVLGGILIGLVIVALLAVIAVLLVSGDDDGSSEAARVTATPTATSRPTARATPRAIPTSTVAPSTASPGGQQAAAVTTTAQQTPPPAAPQETAAPPAQQPSATSPPSAPPATTAPGETCPGPPVIASFTANPGTITLGDPTTLSWGPATNVAHVVIDHGIGEVGEWDSMVVTPGATTVYTLTATGCGGTTSLQATVIVNLPPPTPTPTEPPPPSGGGSWGQSTPTPTEPPPPSGGGSWGITPIDLAVTGLNPDNLPQGEVWVTLANNGPYKLENAQVTLSCSGTTYFNADGTAVIAGQPQTISVSLDVGWSNTFDTGISIDTTIAIYFLQCSIEPVSFKDDITDNNSNSAWIPS